jgi:RHS repeat-associated protein
LTGENYSIPNISYDKNSNITSLQRNGKIGSSFGLMDNLSYTYSGNRLSSVNDAVSGDHEVDFVKRGSGAYTYWENGALKSDENEQITNITYNTFLNQPEQVTLSDGSWIKHIYDGSGTLIKTEYSTGEYWEFTPGIVFKNGAFYQMVTPEGRAIYEGETWKLEFDYKDHTGNTRASFKADGNRLVHTAKTDTDPFGVILKTGQENSFQNRHEMQGHEREKTFGLNRINFGARSYNPTIGRFDRVDPLAELDLHLSNYSYVGNNPLKYVDLFGLKREKVKGEEDTYRETTPFDPVVIAGKRDKVNQAMGFDKYYQYLQNHSQDESFIKVKQSFREGGNMAAGMVMAPLAAIGAAELGAGSALAAGITRLGAIRTLSVGRATLRTALAKGAFNLGGQGISNALDNKMRLDLTGLGLDMIAPNNISALTGFGGVGFDFKEMSFYEDIQLDTKGVIKTGLGLGFGRVGGGLQNIMGANGFSSAMSNMAEGIIKVYNEVFNSMIDKFPAGQQNGKKSN